MATTERGDTLKILSKSYVAVYSVLPIAAAIHGFGVDGWGQIPNLLFLTLIGGLSLLGFLEDWTVVKLVLSGFWAFATVGEWLQLITWSPALSGMQSMVLTGVNLCQAVALAVLSEVWRIGEGN